MANMLYPLHQHPMDGVLSGDAPPKGGDARLRLRGLIGQDPAGPWIRYHPGEHAQSRVPCNVEVYVT